jgi:hypothetical protein
MILFHITTSMSAWYNYFKVQMSHIISFSGLVSLMQNKVRAGLTGIRE